MKKRANLSLILIVLLQYSFIYITTAEVASKTEQKDGKVDHDYVNIEQYQVDLSLTEAHEIISNFTDIEYFIAKNDKTKLNEIIAKKFNGWMGRFINIWRHTDRLVEKMTEIATTGIGSGLEKKVLSLEEKFDQMMAKLKLENHTFGRNTKLSDKQVNENGLRLIILYKIAETISRQILENKYNAESFIETLKTDPIESEKIMASREGLEKQWDENKMAASYLNANFYRTKAEMYARRQTILLRQIVFEKNGRRIALQKFVEELDTNLGIDLMVNIQPLKEKPWKWALLWQNQAPAFAKSTLLVTDAHALIETLNPTTLTYSHDENHDKTVENHLNCLMTVFTGLEKVEKDSKLKSKLKKLSKTEGEKEEQDAVNRELGRLFGSCTKEDVNSLKHYIANFKNSISEQSNIIKIAHKAYQKVKPFVNFGKQQIMNLNEEFGKHSLKVELLMVNKAAEMIVSDFIQRIQIAKKRLKIQVDRNHYKSLQKQFRGRQMIIVEELLKAASNTKATESSFILKDDLKELFKSLHEQHLDEPSKEIVIETEDIEEKDD